MEPPANLRAEDLGVPASRRPPRPRGVLAALDGATGWLNSPPLTEADLRGRVVLVQFWTYTCINWLRTLAYVRAWARRYADQGLVVVGVHTPEFDVEQDVTNVRRAAQDLGVDYPIALDTDYAIWEGFANRFWPALYLVDAAGRIRHHRFGEGDDETSERVLQELLTEAGARGVGTDPTPVEPRGVEIAADWDDIRSGETYLGYDRTQDFVSARGTVLDASHTYAIPDELRLNQWALSGAWTVRPEAVVLEAAGGSLAFRFHARDLHLVMGPADPDAAVRFRVGLDGRPPGTDHGLDADAGGEGSVTMPRLHQLVRQSGPITDRTFEITFLDPGLRAYVVTFG
jgi:thiol-disulfide isomerase/thioredoxin